MALVLKGHAAAELTVKNSRFLSEVFPVDTPDAAREIWRGLKRRYDNGGHIVYAFITGPQGNISGCSDDGEPSGSAGRPVLEVLRGAGATGVVLTVARWFGGTKLGVGGLVRAYTASAQAVLARAELLELVAGCRVSITVFPPAYGAVRRMLEELEFETTGERFSEVVEISGSIREERLTALRSRLNDLTRGKCSLQEERK